MCVRRSQTRRDEIILVLLFGIPRMNPELAWMVAIFWIGREPRCEVSMAPAFQTVRTAFRGSHLAIFPDIGTHSSGLLALNARPIERLTLALVVAAAAVPR